MNVAFTKMNGAGNDFVVIDNRALDHDLSKKEIAFLCDRHRGVGADGLLAVEPAQNGADYRFRYYNADGGEAEMCGNGARCYARFASRLEGDTRQRMTFETVVGILEAEFFGEEVRIRMSLPEGLRRDCPTGVENLSGPVFHLDTGVPHAVVFVESVEETDVFTLGAALRHAPCFAPRGANANFVEITGPSSLKIRTYERGVEGETLACGTGVTAAALVHHLESEAPSPIRVEVRGGDILEIGFEKSGSETFSQVTLKGPADFVFEGRIAPEP